VSIINTTGDSVALSIKIIYSVYLETPSLKMEPQKRTWYSKRLAAEETEEIMMEDESDEELEELNEFTEPHENTSSSSSGNEALAIEGGNKDVVECVQKIRKPGAHCTHVKIVTVCVSWTTSRSGEVEYQSVSAE
jgi:hypothetical protein